MRKSNLPRILPALVLLCSSYVMQAQTSNTSPYSGFGLGKLNTNSHSMMMALGGTAYALRSPLYVNPYNPASYSSFDTTSFVFDAALQAKLMTLSSSTASYKVNDASLAYITMGFPITRLWKSSLGLVPYSTVSYLIGTDSIKPDLGKIEYRYSGSGGINKAFIGNAFKLSDQLSVGVNVSYFFGTIKREESKSYPDSSYHFSAKISNSAQIRNIVADFGMQYYTTLKNGMNLSTGLVFSPGQSMSGTANNLMVRFYHNSLSNLDVIKDTSYDEKGIKGKVFLPMNLGAGFSLGRSNQWAAYADIHWQQWSKYTYFGNSQSLKNSYGISIGGQYKPATLDVGKYWKRINYRAGARFEQSYLEIKDTRLNEVGISFGAGLPLKKSRSTLNLAFEVGTFGSTDNNLIKENFFRFSLGAALFEKWFLKRKYD